MLVLLIRNEKYIDNSKVQEKNERFFPQNTKPDQSKTILHYIMITTKEDMYKISQETTIKLSQMLSAPFEFPWISNSKKHPNFHFSYTKHLHPDICFKNLSCFTSIYMIILYFIINPNLKKFLCLALHCTKSSLLFFIFIFIFDRFEVFPINDSNY